MNTALLTEIKEWLEEGAPGDWDFDMTVYFEAERTSSSWCGTACCIAGAALLFGDPECVEVTLDNMSSTYSSGQHFWWMDNVDELAAELLGLDPQTASELFAPWSHNMDNPLPDELPASLAAKVIDHLIQTGEVQWHQ